MKKKKSLSVQYIIGCYEANLSIQKLSTNKIIIGIDILSMVTVKDSINFCARNIFIIYIIFCSPRFK